MESGPWRGAEHVTRGPPPVPRAPAPPLLTPAPPARTGCSAGVPTFPRRARGCGAQGRARLHPPCPASRGRRTRSLRSPRGPSLPPASLSAMVAQPRPAWGASGAAPVPVRGSVRVRGGARAVSEPPGSGSAALTRLPPQPRLLPGPRPGPPRAPPLRAPAGGPRKVGGGGRGELPRSRSCAPRPPREAHRGRLSSPGFGTKLSPRNQPRRGWWRARGCAAGADFRPSGPRGASALWKAPNGQAWSPSANPARPALSRGRPRQSPPASVCTPGSQGSGSGPAQRRAGWTPARVGPRLQTEDLRGGQARGTASRPPAGLHGNSGPREVLAAEAESRLPYMGSSWALLRSLRITILIMQGFSGE